MDEVVRQLAAALRGMWRRRWLGIAVAWVVAAAAAVVLSRIPDRFEASSRIFVDTESVLRPLMSGLTVQPDVNQQIAMLARTLITVPNLERLIRDADLSIHVKDDRERERLIDDLTREIKLTGGGRENLYLVTYRDTDPRRATRVVQTLTTMFVDSGLGGKKRDAEAARVFIDEQIKSYEKKLEEAEAKRKDFKLRNLAYSTTGAGKDFFGQMSSLNEELDKVRLELHATEQARDSLKRELIGEDPSLITDVVPTAPSAVPELDARIEALKKQLDDELRRYTEDHPDVKASRRLLGQLEAQRQMEIDARKRAEATKPAGGATNPVFQRIKIALTEAEANVASLRGRAAELEGRVKQLKASAGKQPELEAELAQLNRDYDVLRRQYDQLVAKRESASISEDADATGQLAEFKIIDPPRVSPKPVFPNRATLAPLALLAAIGVGGFVSFLMAQLFPTVGSANVLRELGQRPVLGTISMRPDAVTIKRQRMSNLAFAGAFSTLLVVFGAWIVWQGMLAAYVR